MRYTVLPRAFRQLLAGVALATCAAVALSTPDKLPDVNRTQTESATPKKSRLMRIWLINIDQGDSILIQLPPAVSQAMSNPASDPVDILVDGGSRPKSNADRAREFLHELCGANPTVEYMILTHHDQDHIAGLTMVLEDASIAVKHVHYNGLSAFRKGVKDLTPANPGKDFVLGGKRVLGRFDSGKVLESKYILPDLGKLDQAFHGPPPDKKPQLITEFEDFAGAAVKKPVETFRRARFGDSTPGALDSELTHQKTTTAPSLKFKTLWPEEELRRYGDWGKTTNGNSVVFRLDYGDFSMLFTGDLNEESGPGLIDHLADVGLESSLDVDVLKAPYHGSEHVADVFIKHPKLKPVVTVASMGSEGFRLTGHKHPRDTTIDLLGGPERFYSTYIHEEPFSWKTLKENELKALIEDTHVLIETDGTHFRVVEVPRDASLTDIDPVTAVDPHNGTLWITAK